MPEAADGPEHGGGTVIGLRTHLVGIVAAALIPAFAVGAAAVWAAVDGYKTAFKGGLLDTARALALAADREIGTYQSTLTGLAAAPLLDEGATEADLADFHARAREVAEALGTWVVVNGPDYRTQVHTLAAPGAPLGGGLRLPEPEAPMPRVFATGRPAVGGIAAGRVSGRPVAFTFVPVARGGRVVRAVGMAIDPTRLSDLLMAQAHGSAFATLADGNSLVVARSRDHERFVGQRLLPWIVEGTVGRESGLLRGPNRLGEETISAFRRLSAAPGWMVIVGEPITAYHGAVWRPVAAFAFGGVGTIVLALIIALAIGRRVMRPVDALTRQAEAVVASGGEAAVEGTPPGRVAEFERLRQAVQMAEGTLRARAAEVAAGEARLRVTVEAARFSTWEYDTRHGVGSRRGALAEAIPTLPPSGFGFADWMALVHPDDRPRVEAAYTAVMRGIEDRAHEEFRVRTPDGTWAWVESAGAAVERDAHTGRVLRMAGIAHDVTRRREAGERQRLLAQEVNHRAKNILAVVQSVLRLTPRDQPGAFAAAETRVAGLARAHSLLAEGGWLGADLRVVAERELASFTQTSGDRGSPAVLLGGPPVTLAPSAVQPIAMVLHELATNAAKHGALSAPGGRLEVCWRTGHREGEDGLLRLLWAETGGPPIAGPPGHRGFGTRVVEATVRGQLGGSVEQCWEPGGLAVEVAVPLARVLADGKPIKRVSPGAIAQASAA